MLTRLVEDGLVDDGYCSLEILAQYFMHWTRDWKLHWNLQRGKDLFEIEKV